MSCLCITSPPTPGTAAARQTRSSTALKSPRAGPHRADQLSRTRVESHRSVLGYMLVLVDHHLSTRRPPHTNALTSHTTPPDPTHAAPSAYESMFARQSFQLRPCRIQRCPKLVISSCRRARSGGQGQPPHKTGEGGEGREGQEDKNKEERDGGVHAVRESDISAGLRSWVSLHRDSEQPVSSCIARSTATRTLPARLSHGRGTAAHVQAPATHLSHLTRACR